MTLFLSVTVLFFTLVTHADDLKCTVKSEEGEYPPHTKVEADLNGDGIKDLFYLAGEEDVFQTCIFIAEKTKTGIQYKLKHSHSDFYDTVLDFDGSGTPQVLVPKDIEAACGDSYLDLIPEKLKPEIKRLYTKWSKPFEKYNFTYNMPEMFPLNNLYLLNEVKIYTFKDKDKIEGNAKAKSYFELKKKVLTETLKNKSLSGSCKNRLKATLKALN